jgi:hypothetical protein
LKEIQQQQQQHDPSSSWNPKKKKDIENDPVVNSVTTDGMKTD